jgi:hypothetical protein
MPSRTLALSLLGLALVLSGCESDFVTGTRTEPEPGFRPQTPSFITGGSIDATDTYANVGAFVVKNPTTGRIFVICSGTLISPTAFLTAAHCTDAYVKDLALRGFVAFVSFSNPIATGAMTDLNAVELIPALQVVTNPAFRKRQSDSGDIGVLIVDEAETAGIAPATLPTLNLLGTLGNQRALRDAVFTAVGYGWQGRVTEGVPFFQIPNPVPRMYASSSFLSLNRGYLRMSQNPATGDGGTCNGDSGGPNFFPVNGQRILVSSTVTGDTVCRSTNVTYRLDTAAARSFLGQFVTLP